MTKILIALLLLGSIAHATDPEDEQGLNGHAEADQALITKKALPVEGDLINDPNLTKPFGITTGVVAPGYDCQVCTANSANGSLLKVEAGKDALTRTLNPNPSLDPPPDQKTGR